MTKTINSVAQAIGQAMAAAAWDGGDDLQWDGLGEYADQVPDEMRDQLEEIAAAAQAEYALALASRAGEPDVDVDTIAAILEGTAYNMAEAVAAARVAAGIACEVRDDCLILAPGHYTVMTSDSGDEVSIEATTAREAAEEYVDGGDWAGESTTWITVTTWVDALDHNGERVRLDEREYTITIPAEVPDCVEGHDHHWASPYSIVGGGEENPGVFGHGGGVVIVEVCRHCGLRRHTDTWATDPATGEQGLRSVEYERPDED